MNFSHPKTGFRIIVLIILAFFLYTISIKIEKIIRWGKYIKKIKELDGVIITRQGRSDGNFYIEGLKDSIDLKPEIFLSDFGFDSSDVNSFWKDLLVSDPGINLQNLIEFLNPPDYIRIEFNKGHVIIKAPSENSWVKRAIPLIKSLSGINEVELKSDQ